jgi:quercetin dioxygenase-like cupin family protein
MANFEKSTIYDLQNSVEYSDGSIVSKIVEKNESGSVTLFSFAEGQFLSEHTTPFDALVQIVEGTAKITIDKLNYTLNEGEIIIIPANVPHAVDAPENFKMLLTMIKG